MSYSLYAMGRTFKQIAYGTAYLVLIFLLTWGVYGVWFKKIPTCFDNIQNQGEAGVDCGGPCAPCATKNLKIDASVSPLPLQAGQDQSAILVTLKNRSGDYGVNFSYDVTVHSIIGYQIDEFTGTSYILPNGSRYLVLPGVTANAIDVGLVDVRTSNTTWVPSAQMTDYGISIDKGNTVTDIGQDGGYVDGEIYNSGTSDVSAVRLSAIIYDVSGNIIGASEYDIGGLVVSQKEAFKVPFPSMDARTAASIDKTRTEVFYEVTKN